MRSDQSTISSSNLATQSVPDDRPVDVFVRGGYPVDREVIFSLAVRLSEHYNQSKPIDCEDRGKISNRVNDFLGRYEDLDCTTVGNPADPAGYTWIIATTPYRCVQVRRSELDNLKKDPWRPPSAFELQEGPLDVDAKEYLAQNDVQTRPFHITFWNKRTW